jgi:hypothetical protein
LIEWYQPIAKENFFWVGHLQTGKNSNQGSARMGLSAVEEGGTGFSLAASRFLIRQSWVFLTYLGLLQWFGCLAKKRLWRVAFRSF